MFLFFITSDLSCTILSLIKKSTRLMLVIPVFHIFLYLFSMSKRTEAVARRCSVKKVFLEISQNSKENTCARVSFLIKLRTSACNFIKKETLAKVFSCEFCEISKSTFFYKTPPVAASKRNRHQISFLILNEFQGIN